MEHAYLEFREGTSDKFYRIIAVQVPSGDWVTTCWWGRRGSNGQTQIKYMGPSEAAAKATVSEFYHQKRAKGYVDASDPLGPAAKAAPATPVVSAAPSITHTPNTLMAALAAVPGVPRFPAMKARERDIDWDDLEDYVMEEKFDGHRAGLTFSPDGTIAIRNVYGEDKGRIENTPHIRSALFDLNTDSLRKGRNLYEGTLIDGELVGLSLQETTHLLGAGGKNDPRLRFVAFDLPFLAGSDLRDRSWIFRRGRLMDLLDSGSSYGGYGGYGPISLATIYPPDSSMVEAIWDAGGEGAILKPTKSKYVPGGRHDWIKLKQHHTADAVISGWAAGAGKYNNQLGALKLSQFVNGVFIEVTKVSGMTDKMRLDMTMNWNEYVGKVIEFEYQQKTPDSYRHPRFVRMRPDKKPTDCTWEASP